MTHHTLNDCISDRVNQLAPSGIRKFFDLLSSMEGVISLGVGEPDFTTPWQIREAAIHSLEEGYTMYTSNSGMIELRQEIARYLKRTFEVDYDPETEILITNGVSEGLDLAVRAILNPGDEVILPDPHYVSYPSCVLLAGGVPVHIPTNCENAFKLRAAEVESKITERTKAILIGFPSNPTGAIMEKTELAEIADVARRHNLLVISDEIYNVLVYNTEPVCFASIEGMRKRTMLLGGFSKAYAMTGWRIGYAAGHIDVIAAMTKIHQYTALCASIMGQKAAIEAMKTGEAEAKRMVRDYDRRRRVIVKGLNDIGLTCFEPKGAFYAFPSINVTGLSSDDFAEKLLFEEKVAVVPGTAFGQCGEGHVRCCYATSMREIEEALKRMERFVKKQKQHL